MKAMVLAAGRGTCLFPSTGALPKPMAPVADKPMIQHIFELLSRAGAIRRCRPAVYRSAAGKNEGVSDA